MDRVHHMWIIGSAQPAAVGDACRCPMPPGSSLVVVDCALTKEQAGACAELVRQLHPWLLEHDPTAIRANYRTIRLLAPDLFSEAGHSESRRDALTPGEVRLLAYGLPELLHAWGSHGSATIVLSHADSIDATDATLVASLLHSLPPDLVRLVIRSTTNGIPSQLRDALTSGTKP